MKTAQILAEKIYLQNTKIESVNTNIFSRIYQLLKFIFTGKMVL